MNKATLIYYGLESITLRQFGSSVIHEYIILEYILKSLKDYFNKSLFKKDLLVSRD